MPCLRRTVAGPRCCVLLLLVVAGARVHGQSSVDGALRGVVTAGVTLRVEVAEEPARDTTWSRFQVVTADAKGRFLLRGLRPGKYAVCMDGGMPCGPSSPQVVIVAGEVTEWLPGSSAMAAQPESNAEESSHAGLQTGGDDAADVADRDDPATEDDRGEQRTRRDAAEGSGQASVSFAGLSPIEDVAVLDGLSQRQGYRAGTRGAAAGGPRSSSAFDDAAVRSLRVMPRTFSAQYGAAGAVLATVTRSGGTELHGSASLQVRTAGMAATNPFSLATHYRDGAATTAPVKPQGSVERFGVAAGGPLGGRQGSRAHEVVVFGALEAQLRQETVVSTPITAPGAANFYSLTPVQRGLLGTRGVSEAATNTALNYLDSLSGETQRTAERLNGFARVDVRPGARDGVTLGYTANLLDAPRGAALGQVTDAVVARGRGSIGDSDVRVGAVSGRWMHTLSPRWNAEMRGQVAHDLEYETPHAPLAQEPGIGVGGLAPQVAIAENTFAYGTPASLGRSAYPDEQRVQLAVATQVRMGQHVLTAGGDWSRLHDRVAAVTNSVGSFNYDSGLTGGAGVAGAHAGGLVDWITDFTFNVNAYPNGGCPNIAAAVHYFCFRSFTQSFAGNAPETQFVTHEVAAFVEDAVRVRPDLALTLGARWDYTLLPPPQTVNTALDAELGTLDPAFGGLTGRIPEDRNNYGLRLGASYAPGWLRGATVTLGAGTFYGQVPGATVRAALVNTALPSTVRSLRITPVTVTACPQVAPPAPVQGFGYPCAYTSEPPMAVAQTTSATVFARRFRLPAVQRATLAVARAWGNGVELRAEYATAMAMQLPSSTDLNVAPATGVRSFVLQGGDGRDGVRDGEMFALPVYTARRFADVGPVSAIQSHANATYHAATVEARWQGRGALHGLTAGSSFTFSRAIDYGPQQGATPRTDSQFDPFVSGYDKGLSSLNFPQRFRGHASYEVHLRSGAEWVRSAVGGWRVGAVATAGSGRPYSYQIFGGDRLSGGRESINGSGGAAYLPTAGRNTLRMSARGSLDVRVSREIDVRGARMEVYAEADNALNTRNLSAVETRAFLVGTPASAAAATPPIYPLIYQSAAAIAAEGIAATPFGVATSSTTGLSRERQVAVGLRVNF